MKMSMDGLMANNLCLCRQDGTISSCLGTIVPCVCTDVETMRQELPNIFISAVHFSGKCDSAINFRFM